MNIREKKKKYKAHPYNEELEEKKKIENNIE